MPEPELPEGWTRYVDPATGDEYFTLCNKKLHLKDMPRGDAESAESNVTFFGVREWKHDNLNKAIAIENRFGKRDGGTQNVVRVYGRTGNQIQEFFHAFDMARDEGGALSCMRLASLLI